MTSRPEKSNRHLSAMYSFMVLTFKERFLWDFYYRALRPPKVRGAVPHDDPRVQREIIGKLKKNGLNVKDYAIDINDYKAYIEKAEYPKYPSYRVTGGGGAKKFVEKTLEHYLAAKLLNFSRDDIYIDVGSADSPAPEIYNKLYGCKTFRQDIVFPKGRHGNIIGGDACAMSVEDGFATKIGLHCSFEHFEQNSDVKFIQEASRVLRTGGKMVILPLYLFNKYAVQTNPASMPRGGIPLEKDVTRYCLKNWSSRFNRFYDVPHFISRIVKNSSSFEKTIYTIANKKTVDPSCYISFAAVFEKI
jgi:SAM-dependent methyltransferase